jgi:hypothetical protein
VIDDLGDSTGLVPAHFESARLRVPVGHGRASGWRQKGRDVALMSTSDVAATLAATRNGVWMAYSPRELAKLGVDYIVSDNPGSILAAL